MENQESKELFDEEKVQELVKKVQEGKYEYFEELWMTFSKYVFWIMRFQVERTPVLDELAALSLTNDVCTKLFMKIEKYQRREGVSFISWLHRIALNMKVDYLKEMRKQPESLDELAERQPDRFEKLLADRNTEAPMDTLVHKEDALLKAGAINLLPVVLNNLSPEDRFVITAHYWEKISYEEISLRLTGNREKADRFRKRKERALEKLRVIYNKQYGIKKLTLN